MCSPSVSWSKLPNFFFGFLSVTEAVSVFFKLMVCGIFAGVFGLCAVSGLNYGG